ncbi:MAG: type IV pilus twitching motility protein PilT [Betaproteobacteria bacterium]
MELFELLAFVVKSKASDLHLSPGLPPMVRVNGEVRRLNLPELDSRTVHVMIYSVMSDAQRKLYEETMECDFSFEIPQLARFRANVLVESRGTGAVLRTIPTRVPSLEELNAPKVFRALAELPRGLVLVTGATGSGKSTTLAAMLDHVNQTQHGHIVTIEDPIEFVHASKNCLVRQRELGPHTLSFANALRSALREDPDVILVGELRDLDTIRLALTAAETGHLVFGTLHTSSAAKTVDRIVDVFPAEEKEVVRTMLADSLQGVLAQALVRTKDGAARVAAHEIMVCNAAIRAMIKENKLAQITGLLPTQRDIGNQTLDQALQDLVRRNVVSIGDARALAVNKDSIGR